MRDRRGETLFIDRQNVFVIADEAHRSQSEFGSHVVKRKDGTSYIAHGLAVNIRDAMPNASFIGFTGTPLERTDVTTKAVFGDYISVYAIQRAVADKAMVPIYYESRIAKLALNAPNCRSSTRSSKKSPKGKSRQVRRSSKPSGARWKRWVTTN